VVVSALLNDQLQFTEMRSTASSSSSPLSSQLTLCDAAVREAAYRDHVLSTDNLDIGTQECVLEGHVVFFTDVNLGVLAKFSVPVPDVTNALYWSYPLASSQAAQLEQPLNWTAESVSAYVLRQNEADGNLHLVVPSRPTWLLRGLIKPSSLLLESAGAARYGTVLYNPLS
jgi:hypothetical protein